MNSNVSIKERESQFELLRIVAQWMIVFFHLFLVFTKGYQETHPIYKGIQIPLHIGVILFVLISGYFGIKRSFKGVVRLLAMTAIYYLPIAIVTDSISGMGGGKILFDLLFISYTPYWFIRTYLFLYLLSPIINKYLDGANKYQRFILIFVLAYMAIWMGTLKCDTSLVLGKNIVNFFLIYTIGNTLFVYQNKWKSIGISKLILLYVVLNLTLVFFWMICDEKISEIIMSLSFPYCSPLLYINAILLFMIFGKLKFKSDVINHCASSIFAVYLIHCQPWILNNVIGSGANAILELSNSKEIYTILLFGLFALIIVVVCIFIDKLFSPLWKLISDKADKLERVITEKIS